jgi:hypothetical protein
MGVALPEVRLHAFRGVLAFAGADHLRADVAFASSPEADEAAWVAGELTILQATWCVRRAHNHAVPTHTAMEGRARLVVTSTAWSLEGGTLTGEQANVRFSGRGRTEASDGDARGAGGAIDAATLDLDGARIGAFLDALQAVVGRTLHLPPGVPLDARLEGSLAWEAVIGGRCALHVMAHGLDARVTGQVGPDGRGLAVRAEGELSPAVPMRSVAVPEALLPRAEDALSFVVEATGHAARPDVQATFRAKELGFRLGRPRFLPPLVARDVEAVVNVPAGEMANLRASARAAGGALIIEGTVAFAKGGARTFTVRATDLEPSWVVPAACALARTSLLRIEEEAARPPAGTFAVPRDARFSAELVVLPGAASVSGHATMTTPRGVLALRPLLARRGALEGTRLHGRVAVADALRMNLFPGGVRPAPHGTLDVDVAVSGVLSAPVLRGMVAAPAIHIAIAPRPDVPVFLLEDISASLTVDRTSLALRELRFGAYGGVFTGESTIPFDASNASLPALELRCHNVHGSFVEALASLARGRRKVRVERPGARPDGELWIPSGARVAGQAKLGADLALTTTLALTVSRGAADADSSLMISFVLAPDLRVDGSTLRGTLALRDALTVGLFDATLRPLPYGVARIEATLTGPLDDCVLSGLVTAARLRFALHEGGGEPRVASPVFVLTDLSALVRLDASKLVWHRLATRAYGGTLASTGVILHAGGVVGLQATIAARGVSLGHLPLDDTRTLGEIARGWVALDLQLDRQGAGPLTGRGDLCLDAGTFPLLARSKPLLHKYGLAAPAENAIAPATCTIHLNERGWSFCDARAAVPGCQATGRVDVGTDGVLDGGLVVTLSHELLDRSAVTVLPSLLAEHLTVPVRITGSAAHPQIHADLAACFGNLLSDNRVSAILSGAAADVASLFTGKAPPAPPPASAPPRPMHPDPYGAGARGDAAEEDALLRDLVASGADWDEIDARIEAHRRSFVRHRIG